MASSSKAVAAKERGNEAFRKGQYAEAVGLYTEAILSDSTNATYPLNRSMAYLKLAKYEDAERDATTSIRLDPANVKAYYRRGSARRQMAKREEAIADYEKVLSLDASNKDAKTEIVAIQKELQDADKKEVEKKSRPPLDFEKRERIKKVETEKASGESSSVEAARKFLEQVGMDTDPKTSGSQAKDTAQSQVPPTQYPGEINGVLREVSTRKLDRNAAQQMSSKEEKEDPSIVALDSPRKDHMIMDATDAENEATIASLNALADIDSSRTAKSHASDCVLIPTSDLPALSRRRKLSAYDFFREWRQVATATLQDILDFLSSIDLEALPQMLGSLLEPDLLVSLLEGLLRLIGPKSSEETKQGETQRLEIASTVMRVLPACDRFETALIFLSPGERKVASNVLTLLGQRGVPSAEAISKPWTA